MIIDNKEYEIHLSGKIYHCALDVTMDVIGGKWRSVVLWYLRKSPKRFTELKRHIPDITEKMLAIQLRQLEQEGYISREVFPEVPPRVEYRLTAKGESLCPVLEAIAEWGRQQFEHGEIKEKVR